MRQSREERERGEGKGRKRGKRKEKGGKKVEGFRRCLIGQKGLKGTREERAHYWRGRSKGLRQPSGVGGDGGLQQLGILIISTSCPGSPMAVVERSL